MYHRFETLGLVAAQWRTLPLPCIPVIYNNSDRCETGAQYGTEVLPKCPQSIQNIFWRMVEIFDRLNIIIDRSQRESLISARVTLIIASAYALLSLSVSYIASIPVAKQRPYPECSRVIFPQVVILLRLQKFAGFSSKYNP